MLNEVWFVREVPLKIKLRTPWPSIRFKDFNKSTPCSKSLHFSSPLTSTSTSTTTSTTYTSSAYSTLCEWWVRYQDHVTELQSELPLLLLLQLELELELEFWTLLEQDTFIFKVLLSRRAWSGRLCMLLTLLLFQQTSAT